jgi:hypothetical protein
MRTTLCLLLSATACLAGWQDENPHKDDYRRTEAWKMSPSLWTPAAAVYGTYWAKDGRVVLVIDDGQWAARGFTASTVAAYNAQTIADCTASGGSWSNGACVYPPPPVVEPTPQQFPTGIEAAEITLNPYLDGHGYQFRRDSDGVIIGVESHSTKKTKAEIDAGEKAISDARKADRELILKLIERRMDTINTNNLVTTAQGRFTVFSATMEQVKGGIATVKGTARWRGVTIDATASNSCTFQVWTAQNAKAGVETNNWTITLWK